MKYSVTLIIVLLCSCQNTKTAKISTNSQTPSWVHSLSAVEEYNTAKIISHKVIKYDDTVFKFKHTPKQSSPQQKIDENIPSNALHVVINNGKSNDKKEKPVSLNLSRVESIYHSLMGLSGGKAIKQIGYKELTNNKLSSNTPITDNYIIGPGDKISIDITGSLTLNKTYTVNDKGLIFISDRIGAIHMHGAQKKDLSQIIHNAVSREFKSFKLDVNLTGLRTIRILLTGNVTQPGLKNLVAGSSLLDALSISGGVHKDGSLRSIRVKSKNGTLQQIDLYELLFKGNQAVDLQLHSGDQIIIPPIGETTCLLGATGQGIYETKGESLKDLLKIHGQINAFVAQERIFFEKTIKQKSREVYSIDINKALEMKLKDGFIFEFQSIRNELDNTVEISGEVSRPGKYPWTPGMTVKDLIDKSDGFLLKASLHKALIRRRLNGEAIYQKAGGLGITRVREELIWLPLDKILAGDDSQNIELQRFDTLRIMAITDLQDTPQVEIIGAIRKSGAYNLSQNMTLLDLVTLAGNPAKSAYPGQGVIVRKVYNRQKHNFDVKMYHFNVLDVINHKQSSLITLEDGDRVIIRTSASYSVKVSINGQVQFPGSYILPSNSKITDLIKAAGGLLSRADLRAAEFSRESIRKLQEKRLDELFEKTRQRLTRSRSTMTRDGRLKESYASTMELRSLEKLKNDMFSRQIKGRIVLNFLQKDFPKSYDNLNLEENDNLIIPQKMNSIMVMGHVYSPNAYIWRKNMTVKDYLNMSGGYRDEAGKDELYLVLSSGQVKSVKQIGHSKLMATIPGPGDSILIPKKELERSNLAVASDYISILRQAAELGAISNAIPNANEAKIGINSDQSTRQVNGGSYNPLMK